LNLSIRVEDKNGMQRLSCLALFGCVLAASCATGKVKQVDTADKTPPELTLSVTALDPDTQMSKSATVKANESATLGATENTDIVIVATAKDAGGIKALRIWNIGAHLKDMSKGEVLGTPANAYSSVTTAATMTALPGFKLGVFAEAQNFGAGDASTTTVLTGAVSLPVSGGPEPVFTGLTKTAKINFSWNPTAMAYVSAGAPSPMPGATVVGVEVGNPFGGGLFVSLYRGPDNINSLALRTDFVRVWPSERANFFNGPWSSQPWYILEGNSRTQGFPDEFSIDLRWNPS
jgi:hypothetical protein